MLFFDAPYMDTDSDELRLIIGLGRQLAAEVRRLREPESDEAWMRRVYPQHLWTPDDGISYPGFCRLSRSKWEAEHAGLLAERDAAREREEELRVLVQARDAERDAARAEAERERIENTHLREAFVTMERAANEREAEAARLREAIERIKVSARGLWEGEAARAALDTPAREGGET
jgi:hypothetical protein